MIIYQGKQITNPDQGFMVTDPELLQHDHSSNSGLNEGQDQLTAVRADNPEDLH